MKILGFSDIHEEATLFEQIQDQISSADLVLIAGDITTAGTVDRARSIIETIERINPALLLVHGNMDPPAIIDYFDQKEINLHARSKMFDYVGLVGVGGSNITPLKTPIEYSEDELASFLTQAYESLGSVNASILVSHVPPYKILDRALFFIRAGSKSVREFITLHQPTICLCGHIHEAQGIQMLGQTMVINPGRAGAGNYAHIELTFEGELPRLLRATVVRLRKGKSQILHTVEKKITNHK